MNTQNFYFISEVSNFIKEYFKNISPDVCDFIGCQFALESNYGKSNLVQERQNYSGMKTPLVRISVACNAGCSTTDDQFARYSNLYYCIYDYILWIQFQRPMAKDLEKINLFCSLIRKYCPERDYIDKIHSIYSQFKTYQNECNKSNSEK